MTNEKIEFLMFTVKETAHSIIDVTVDLQAREYTIAHTDLYGQTLSKEIGGKLRGKTVKQLSEKLSEIDVVSLPLNEKNTLPIHLEDATVMYVIDEETYYTDGDDQKSLSEVHKALEQAIGTTFGSYDFY